VLAKIFDIQLYLIIVDAGRVKMKQVSLEVTEQKNSSGFQNIDADHKYIFSYIDKLNTIAKQPKDYEYAIIILERFIAFFLEHAIKEEQILQQYLPNKIVEEHALLHQNELNYLDESLITLKTKLSSQNIKIIVSQLNREFKNHIYRYDKNIMQQLNEQKG